MIVSSVRCAARCRTTRQILRKGIAGSAMTGQGKRKAKGDMTSRRRVCTICGAESSLFLCTRCAGELRELLVGCRNGEHGQPGIVWYIPRLREQAYLQARLGVSNGAKSSRQGYALLVDKRAIELLTRIHGTLDDWKADLDRLSGTQSDEQPWAGVVLARQLSNRVRELRRHPNSHELHRDLLSYAKQAWRVINRPPDNLCGPCPNMVLNGENQPAGMPCQTMLYAEENATTVRCPRCRALHDVEALRKAMRDIITDMLFTGPELLRLMETRLNDRMPTATFYKMIQDGRIVARSIADDGVKFYTYNDVCQAREKPTPSRQAKARAS